MKTLQTVLEQIRSAETAYHRPSGSVNLVAVSKFQDLEAIKEAIAAGQKAFAENYLQEALSKISALSEYDLEWHYIGRIQSNKAEEIAGHFDWVHGLSSLNVAAKLNQYRSDQRKPINCCIQINISGEVSKSGISLNELRDFAFLVESYPNLRFRGLMTMLERDLEFKAQRRAFHQLFEAKENLIAHGFPLDTLSMGMSGDFEAAIAEGSTLVRIGTAIFGERKINA